MSWSFTVIGRVRAVASDVANKITNDEVSVIAEPERQLRRDVGDLIAKTLAPYPENVAVHVEASGSQWTPDLKAPAEAINQINLKIEVLYGFVE